MTDQYTDPAECATAASMPFPGNPKAYLRLAAAISLGVHAYLFLGYWAIRSFLAGEAWPTTWITPALTILSALFFTHFSYRWIMQLDARYGSGRRWALVPVTVKLPWQKPKPKGK